MTGAAEAASRRVTDLDEVRRRVDAVPDPELPVVTLGQLGVIRTVRAGDQAGSVVVEITPTYSGCPAMEVIGRDVADAVSLLGLRPDVRVVLAPAWSTDWITAEGRTALSDAGIAPPGRVRRGPVPLQIGGARTGVDQPTCPQCGSGQVEELARFGSTACKALWRCRSCREPFDYVKPL